MTDSGFSHGILHTRSTSNALILSCISAEHYVTGIFRPRCQLLSKTFRPEAALWNHLRY